MDGLTEAKLKTLDRARSFERGLGYVDAVSGVEIGLMQRLAKAGRDIDTVIAVHAADLAPNGHTHLVVARELDTAGRPGEALEWAERGIRDTEDLAVVDTASSTTSATATHRPAGSATPSPCAATTSPPAAPC